MAGKKEPEPSPLWQGVADVIESLRSAVKDDPSPAEDVIPARVRREIETAERLEADESLARRLLELLSEKWGNDRPCPYCESSDWTVAAQLIKVPQLRGDGFQPFFGVVCDNCGNTVLIDPDTVDLWPVEDE